MLKKLNLLVAGLCAFAGTALADGASATLNGQIDGGTPGTIPEPALTALAVAGVGYLLLRRRRRRN